MFTVMLKKSRTGMRQIMRRTYQRARPPVEWPGGISPPGSHRSGRERLHSSGSYCPTVARYSNGQCAKKGWFPTPDGVDPEPRTSTMPSKASILSNGFALLKGSSRRAVDLSIKPDSVAPSLQRHYSTLITTTRNSVPVLRIGTRGLVGLPLEHLP